MHDEKRLRRLFSVLISIFLLFSANPAFGTERECEIHYTNGQLELDVDNVSLEYVLNIISEKTKIAFQADKSILDRTISARSPLLPVEKALSKIIGGLNHAIVFDSGGKIKKVILIGGNKSSGSQQKHAPDAEQAELAHSTERSAVGKNFQAVDNSKDMIIVHPDREQTGLTASDNSMVVGAPGEEDVMIVETDSTDDMIIEHPSGEVMDAISPDAEDK